MSQNYRTKQTARKTTGNHLYLSHVLSSSSSSKPKRAQKRAVGATNSRAKSSARKSFLKRPAAAAASSPGSSAPAQPPPTTSFSSRSSPDPFPLCPSPIPGDPAPGPLITWRRPTVHVLDQPISLCTRFATWLESQTYVYDDALVRAVERDGCHFLALARATVLFDNALRGTVSAAVNGPASPLREHAWTLRVFAELLKTKMSEGRLSKELEMAVLRDGEPLLRLALCCLEFDHAMSGSGGTASS